MKKTIALVSFALSSALSFNVWGALPEKFYEVSPGIYRSAQPDKADFKDLKQYGIATILNLNNDKETMAMEKKAAKAAGIQYISHPMSGFWTPDDQQVDESLAVLNDPNNYPILIHCKHGEDRTGLIVGLHRVYAERIDPQTAYQEMLDLGFHKSLVFLDRYYKRVTGLED